MCAGRLDLNAADYHGKHPKEWDEMDCLEWASNTQRLLGLPSNCVSGIEFAKVTGRNLWQYKEADFKQLFGEFGIFFCKKFKHLKKEIREGAGTSSQYASFNPTLTTDQQLQGTPSESFHISGNFSSATATHNVNFSELPSNFDSYSYLAGNERDLRYNDINRDADYDENLSWNFENIDLDSFRHESFHELDEMVHGSSTWEQLQEENTGAGVIGTSSDVLSTMQDPASSASTSQGSRFIQKKRKIKGGTLQEIDESVRKQLLKKISNPARPKRERHPHVYEYLMRLILHPATQNVYIQWEDYERGHFRLLKPQEITDIWASRKTKDGEPTPLLDYDNFARTIRTNYKTTKMLEAVPEKKYVFKFGEEIMAAINRQS